MHINGFSVENQILTACSAAPAKLTHNNCNNTYASICESFVFTRHIKCVVLNTEQAIISDISDHSRYRLQLQPVLKKKKQKHTYG